MRPIYTLKKRKWIYSFRLSSDIAKKALNSSLFLDSFQTAGSIEWPLEFQNFDFIKFFAQSKQILISNHSNNVDIEKNVRTFYRLKIFPTVYYLRIFSVAIGLVLMILSSSAVSSIANTTVANKLSTVVRVMG